MNERTCLIKSRNTIVAEYFRFLLHFSSELPRISVMFSQTPLKRNINHKRAYVKLEQYKITINYKSAWLTK